MRVFCDTTHRFKKKLKKHYNMTDQQAQDEWDLAIRDPKVSKGEDTFGNVTVAKLATQFQEGGRRVQATCSVAETKTHAVESSDDIAALREGAALSVPAVRARVRMQVACNRNLCRHQAAQACCSRDLMWKLAWATCRAFA